MLKLFISILVLCSIVNAQRFVAGPCPTIATDNADFDVQKFKGTWLVTESTPSLFDFVMSCMVHEYEPQKDGTLAIKIEGTSLGNLTVPAIRGDGVIHDTMKNGHYNVRYAFGVPFQGSVLSVIDTNYDQYGVIYSCTNSLIPGFFHNEYVWVLTKTGKLETYQRQNIITTLDGLKINRNGLVGVREKCALTDSKILNDKKREEEIGKSNSNLTITEKAAPAASNVVRTAREETPTDNAIKVA